jgi:hypothetical protein
MKNLFLIFSIGLIVLGSCREQKTETKEVIREVQVETPPSEEKEGILERTAKKIDKEVNEEIDKKIDEIGND